MNMLSVDIQITKAHLEAAIAAASLDPDANHIDRYDLLAQAIMPIAGATHPSGTSFAIDGWEYNVEQGQFDLALQLVDHFDRGYYEDLRDQLPVVLVFKSGQDVKP